MRLRACHNPQMTKERIEGLQSCQSVRFAYLFGFGAKGEDVAGSDVDVAVYFQNRSLQYSKISDVMSPTSKHIFEINR